MSAPEKPVIEFIVMDYMAGQISHDEYRKRLNAELDRRTNHMGGTIEIADKPTKSSVGDMWQRPVNESRYMRAMWILWWVVIIIAAIHFIGG